MFIILSYLLHLIRLLILAAVCFANLLLVMLFSGFFLLMGRDYCNRVSRTANQSFVKVIFFNRWGRCPQTPLLTRFTRSGPPQSKTLATPLTPGDLIQYNLVSRTLGDLIQYNLVSRTPGDLIQYNLVSRTLGDLIQYTLVSRTPGDLIQYTLVQWRIKGGADGAVARGPSLIGGPYKAVIFALSNLLHYIV